MDILLDMIQNIAISDNIDIDRSALNKTPKLSPKRYYRIIESITGQKSFNNTTHAIYTYYIDNFEFVETTVIASKLKNIRHFYFDAIDNAIIFTAVHHADMAKYIINSKNTKIYIPLNYICSATKSGHQSTMVINKENNTVCILDPNGESSYYDKIFDFYTDQCINNIITQYFKKIGEFTGNEYYLIDPYIEKINRTTIIDDKKIGNCVITSIISIYLMHCLELRPAEAFKTIGELSDDEFEYIMSSFILNVLYAK